MANITIYKVEKYNKDYYRIFSGIYNDFYRTAAIDYNFELEPLKYDDFVQSVEKGLLNCIILFEDDIPTGFLVYTTLISEAIELNIIHCIGNENVNAKRKLLIEEFLKINSDLISQKIVTYPLLGKQASFENEIKEFGFNTVNTSVLSFKFSDVNALNKLKDMTFEELPRNYSVTNWRTVYFKDAANILYEAFKNSYDALFDSRFSSINGCKDIIEKITNNIYGDFLPAITKVLLYKKAPVGFCLINTTNDYIANIPAVAILEEHRKKGFGSMLLGKALQNLLHSSISGGWKLKEINVSCDSNSVPSVKMYSSAGFTEEYSYPLAYLNNTK
ncbi:GNAT family N-acetyltransferase [bacterium]|nr:GNAT family N-acetyltransferase [bacterium]